MNPRVHKWLDLLDRAGWTAIQAAGAALVVYLTSDESLGWSEAFTFVGIAAAISVAKVLVGQNTGDDDTGALIGAQVIEPSPTSPPTT